MSRYFFGRLKLRIRDSRDNYEAKTLTLRFPRLSERTPLEIHGRRAKIAKRTDHTIGEIEVRSKCQFQHRILWRALKK